MPMLEIINNPEIDITNILLVMLFPSNQLDRDRHHLLKQTAQYLKNESLAEFWFSRSELELIVSSPSIESWEEKVKNNTKKAIIAGDLAGLLYAMYIFEIPEPSMNKAIHVMKEFALTHEVKYGDGARLPISEQTIRNCWKEYYSVAHLWAAFRLNQDYKINPDGLVYSDDGYINFLKVAAGILKFGKSFVPFRAKDNKAIFYGNDVWELPTKIEPLKLETKQYPDLMITLLKKYKAPNNSSYKKHH